MAIATAVVRESSFGPVEFSADAAHFATPDSESPFDQSLRLLRNTNLRISLFHIQFRSWGLKASRAMVAAVFGDGALVHDLGDCSYALLLVRFDQDDGATTRRVIAALQEATQSPDFEARSWVEVSGLHRDTSAIGDAVDLLAELSLQAGNGITIAAPQYAVKGS